MNMEEIYIKCEYPSEDEKEDDTALVDMLKLEPGSHELAAVGMSNEGFIVKDELDTDISLLHKELDIKTETPSEVMSTTGTDIPEQHFLFGTTTAQKLYTCGVGACTKVFTTKSGLTNHVCNKDFNLKSHLDVLLHIGEKLYKCDICNKSFDRKNNLNSHKRIHIAKNLVSSEKSYICRENKCAKIFNTQSELTRHVCKKDFKQESHLDEHESLHTSEKLYVCNICNKSFDKKSNLNSHKRIHTGEKHYACDICNKGFIRIANLKKHKLTHSGAKLHTCDVCNKEFHTNTRLKRHKSMHTGEKPHICEICNKGFKQKPHLNEHKLIHTGEKLYPCDVCNKRFSKRTNLNSHRRIHTGEKPYACDICNKEFCQKAHLTQHRLIHNEKTSHR